MSWPLVKLKDCCLVVGGATPKREISEYWDQKEIPWVTPKDISNISSTTLDDAPEYISKAGFESCSTYMLPRGSVLVTSRAPIGNIAIAGRELCTNQGFKSLIPGPSLDSLYLYYCMKHSSERLQALGNGATFKEVSKKIVEEFEIPLPPVNAQRRIAAILGKADSVLQKRQQAIKLADEFLRAVFLDMFGDPVTNPKGWTTTSLGAHGEFKNGLNYGREESGNRISCLGVGDFKSFHTIRGTSSLGYIELETLPTEEYLLKNGDLIFVRSNGNRALVGRCITVYPEDEHVTFSGFCIRYRLKTSNIQHEYLNYLFRAPSMKEMMLQIGQGASIQNISQSILSSLSIPCPPLAAQNKFSELVSSFRTSLFRFEKSHETSETLFRSLSQRAFSDEL